MCTSGGQWISKAVKHLEEKIDNNYYFSDGGMSLLKHPSAAMAKLIQSAEKSCLKPGVSDKALQKPVMAFVIQRHDLESLQLAMKLALRKAACRVFALQVRII